MTLILFAILLSFVVLLPKQTGIVLEGFGAPLAHVLAYPVRLLAWMNQGVEDFWDGYIALHHVQGDNERLRRELAVLQGRVHELEEQSAAMERLAALLEFKERTPANTIAAEVIGIDSTNWYRGIILNKGERHGIQTDMGVITPAGVVGRVVKTAAATSIVLLVTDPNMAVTGLIQRTRDEGIVTGSTKGAVYMKYIPLLSTVR
ncbi:MAG: rod shape-determining protein MreC, partial [Nitrospirales bacterium]